MSVNRYRDHVLVLPEDDAYRQLANEFLNWLDTEQVQILSEAGGWTHVCREFASVHVEEMRRYEQRRMILLIDFDGNVDRLSQVEAGIPLDLRDRVFVLGVLTNFEELRRAWHGRYAEIGRAMADDCRNGTRLIWAHNLLIHNEQQLSRLRQVVCAWLFEP